MDGLTAIAFVLEAFEQRHPTPPANFRDYTGTSARGPDHDGNYIVSFVWQRKDSHHGADSFFEAMVSGWNAHTTVLLDTPLDDFHPEDFELYRSAPARET